MAQKSVTKTVYHVHLPYPKGKTFRMVSCHKQPFFICKDIAKAFRMPLSKAIKLASPHLSIIMGVRVVSFYGYWQIVLLGDTHQNRTFQHVFIKTALNNLYENGIKPYLELVQKSDKNGRNKSIRTTKETFRK